MIDTYRREVEPVSFTLGAFSPGSHTVTINALGDGRVKLDYLDVWDGAALPDGVFDHSGLGRFYLDETWDLRTSISPSGQFLRSGAGQRLVPLHRRQRQLPGLGGRHGAPGAAVRGRQLSRAPSTWRRQVCQRRPGPSTGSARASTCCACRAGRATRPSARSSSLARRPSTRRRPSASFQRYEEDWPAILYNGQPYTSTVTTWTRVNNSTVYGASGGQVIWSGTVGDTVTFAFNGVKVGAGFMADRFGGKVEIFVDGVSRGVIDTYRRRRGLRQRLLRWPGGRAAHADVKRAGRPAIPTPAARASIWTTSTSGTARRWPDGTFEQDDARVLRSDGLGYGRRRRQRQRRQLRPRRHRQLRVHVVPLQRRLGDLPGHGAQRRRPVRHRQDRRPVRGLPQPVQQQHRDAHLLLRRAGRGAARAAHPAPPRRV